MVNCIERWPTDQVKQGQWARHVTARDGFHFQYSEGQFQWSDQFYMLIDEDFPD